MTQPNLSIVIPSYNHAPFVLQAISSALESGSRHELEVIVVDDGSTDDTLERLRELEGEPRLRILTQENRGAHTALNRGLGEARGETIFILDSDDQFVSSRLDALVEVLDRSPEVVLVSSWIEIIDEEDRPIGVKHGWHDLPPWPRPRSGPGLSDLGDPVLALLETNWVATTSNFAFRRRLVSEGGLRFLPLRYAHDWEFLLAATREGAIAVVEEPLVRYRVHAANTIAEGREAGGATDGRGQMRFEILWLVARHFHRVLERAVASGWSRRELEERAARSLPRFDCPTLMSKLLFLRGGDDEVPAPYDRLIEPGHPFYETAVRAVVGAEG